MASLKIGSLLLRTLSKPIANKIKQQAKDHDGFKSRTIQMAQFLHRADERCLPSSQLRVKLLGESPRHVRPLSESKAIDTGANFLSETFLFSVAAIIIFGETWRSKRAEGKRRDAIQDALEQNKADIERLQGILNEEKQEREDAVKREKELEKVVEEIVLIGLHGGFGELPDEWKRHLVLGELAKRFRTADRVLRDDDEVEDGSEARAGMQQVDLARAQEVAETLKAATSERAEEAGTAAAGDDGKADVDTQP
ncbi:optic atrophy 3-like family protein [Rhodotorula toruloides]|uniref:BY PROTMAP: gi/472587554/gb/EMS25050.1/ optic atrophy 3-like family protein [Rhodosporidium toruloides NP11] gi/647398602/emb/CDR42649.1/ RHTO0S07e02564g1_1 [Rhodosporidium toruloides] n=1 Tax=Rhodotorula toruloides TaxID=5286 RepID=A0A0K3CKT2_RHOTO|nr:optic atrophy 3-like family protein [Rhodotorula toruloides]